MFLSYCEADKEYRSACFRQYRAVSSSSEVTTPGLYLPFYQFIKHLPDVQHCSDTLLHACLMQEADLLFLFPYRKRTEPRK